jgi:hypothetical protein
MSPVATNDQLLTDVPSAQVLKSKVVNPFYSPSIEGDDDAAYEFAKYKVCPQTSDSERRLTLHGF